MRIKFSKIRLKDVNVIGIDELHTGDGYITIVKDLECGAVLHVGDGKGGNALKGLAKRVKCSRCRIRAVDLTPAYRAWIKNNLANAKIIYDHFHVIKLMNAKIDRLRKRRGRDEKNSKISDLKKIFDELGTATFMKECLRSIYSIALIPIWPGLPMNQELNVLRLWQKLSQAILMEFLHTGLNPN